MINFSVVPHETIRRHQANDSPSKIAHQFSKTERFLAPNPECPKAFYTYESQLSKRQAGFGYGDKHDFTKTLTASPPVTTYNSRSEFEMKNRGKSFGCARDKSPDQSYLIPQVHKYPGPGQYQGLVTTKSPVCFTMRPQTRDMIGDNLSYKQSPGPGAYKSIQLEPINGRFQLSRFGDSKFAKINPRTERFEKIKESPGPHTYREGDNLSEKAKYVLSQRRGNGTRAFEKEARFTLDFWKQKKNPGPGNYEKPSDFGVYGDSKYYKTLDGFKGK